MKKMYKVTMLIQATVNVIENKANEIKSETHFISFIYDGPKNNAVMNATMNCLDRSTIDFYLFGSFRNRQGLVMDCKPLSVASVKEIDPNEINK